ncbi:MULTISPECIES: hypothetical protein [unclassified Carboxylicivirga]|uniref:hypothetical protein n=1 Tax=Carboxylicivirga TaxID=1628153 RepID=UPI003D349557
MKYQALLFTLMLFCGVALTRAQENEAKVEKSFKDKLFTGGSIGLTFGDYTNVMISPLIGARLNEKVYAGLGIEYQYTKHKRYDPPLTYNQFGGRMFTQYNIVPNLFAHGEFAAYSMEQYSQLTTAKERNFVPFIYIGGGYRQMVSKRSFVSVQVLFDILQDKNSPYKAWEPIFSVGFGVGI